MGDNIFMKVGRFLGGYVTVVVEGVFLEKFTNLCVINYLPFWNVKRYGVAKMVGRTTIKGYKKMRHISKKCGCKISLNRKMGIPFFLNRYKKRKIFIIGGISFLILIKVSGMFIWDINVVGNKSDISQEIISQLNDTGIKPGTLKSKIDGNKLSSDLMIRRSDLSWVGTEINGMRLKVKVIEKAKIPEKIDENISCNIVASKAGLIVSIDVLKGTKVVEPSAIVSQGDILVSGVIEMLQFPEKTQRVHALANIEARVWYERSKTLKLYSPMPKEEIEGFAYKIAYDKILKEIPNNVEILNVTSSTAHFDDKVTVSVVVETLEDIGKEVLIE